MVFLCRTELKCTQLVAGLVREETKGICPLDVGFLVLKRSCAGKTRTSWVSCKAGGSFGPFTGSLGLKLAAGQVLTAPPGPGCVSS